MAQTAYGGASDVAHEAIKIYGGDNQDIARKAYRGYVGVNGIAEQFWGDGGVPKLRASGIFVPGGIYELNTCLPIMAVVFALDEIKKICMPSLIDCGVYDTYKSIIRDITNYFITNQGDSNIVYITFQQSTLDEGYTLITVYLGKSEDLEREILDATTYTMYGNKYARLVDDITTNRRFNFRINNTTKVVTRSDIAQQTNTFNTIGFEIDEMYSGSYGIGHNIRLTNLGMTMYKVDMYFDWYWNLGNSFEDEVDGFRVFKNNSLVDTNPNISSVTDYLKLPNFLWEQHRRIKIYFSRNSRPFEEYSDVLPADDPAQDLYVRVEAASDPRYVYCYYKYWGRGELLGVFGNNSSSYSSRRLGFDVTQGYSPRKTMPDGVKGNLKWQDYFTSQDGDELNDPQQFDLGYSIELTTDGDYPSIDISFYSGGHRGADGINAIPITNKGAYDFAIGNFGRAASNNAFYPMSPTRIEVLNTL